MPRGLYPAISRFFGRSALSVGPSVARVTGIVTAALWQCTFAGQDAISAECSCTIIVYGSRKFDHVTTLLRDFYWLHVPERIAFRLAVLVYRCLHGLARPYLVAELHRCPTLGHGSGCVLRPRRWSFQPSSLHSWRPFHSCSSCSDVELPLTAGDVIAVSPSLSATPQDGTLYPFI
jgi:hypothetical protein